MANLKEFVKGQELFFITSDKTVREAVKIMTEANIGAVCVFEGDRLVGMFSERDLMKRVVNKDLNPADVKLSEVMTKQLIVAQADEEVRDALEKMQQLHCRHMPVVENKKLIGVVSLRKLLLHDVSLKTEELKLLDAYITYSPMRQEGV